MQGVGSTFRIECFAATCPRQGRTLNEDAFFIGRGERPFAALCDGDGNAEQTARRVLRLFEKLLNESTPEQTTAAETWTRWVKILDSSLLGGAQSTFLTVAFAGNEAVGVAVGDSQAYVINREGQCRTVNGSSSKQRLGSGLAHPYLIRLTMSAGDIVLLLSGAVWAPHNLHLLRNTVVSSAQKQFSELPAAVLDAAGSTGWADDMTAVAVRLAR